MPKRLVTYGRRNHSADNNGSEAGANGDEDASSRPNDTRRKRKLRELLETESSAPVDQAAETSASAHNIFGHHEGLSQAIGDHDPWAFEDTSRGNLDKIRATTKSLRPSKTQRESTADDSNSSTLHLDTATWANAALPTGRTGDASARPTAYRSRPKALKSEPFESTRNDARATHASAVLDSRKGRSDLSPAARRGGDSAALAADWRQYSPSMSVKQAKECATSLNGLNCSSDTTNKEQHHRSFISEAAHIPQDRYVQPPTLWLKETHKIPDSRYPRTKLRQRLVAQDPGLSEPASGQQQEMTGAESLRQRSVSPSDSTDFVPQEATSEVSQEMGDSQTSLIAERGQKRTTTYAGTRTFLAASQSALDDPLSLENLQEAFEFTSNPGSQDASAFGRQPISAVQSEDAEERSSGLKGLHELRTAGGRARRRGDVDTILDELDNLAHTSASEKRKVFLTIVRRLAKLDNLELFIERNGFSSFMRHVKKSLEPDDIALFLLPLTLALSSARLGATLLDSIAKWDFFTFLVRASSVVHAKELQTETSTTLAITGRTIDWGDGASRKVSLQNMSAFCLRSLATKTTVILELSETDKETLLCDLCRILMPLIQSRAENQDCPIFQTTNILEVLLLTSATMPHSSQGLGTSLMTEVAISIADKCATSAESNHDEIWSCNLRMLLNITNGNELVCGQVCRTNVLAAAARTILQGFEHIQEPDSVDDLVLALVLLLNISEYKRDELGKALNAGKKDGSNWLQIFSEVFSARLAALATATETQEKALENVPLGYLSCLLCSLALEPEVSHTLKTTGSKSILALLHPTAREFVKLHEDVTHAMVGISEQNIEKQKEVTEVFTKRMGLILEELSLMLEETN